jgi:hypothetical protein
MTQTLGSLLGTDLEDDFSSFDLTEIQEVLSNLKTMQGIDLAHAEVLQQQALRAADIASELIGRLIKTTSYLEGRVNTVKNRASLEYAPASGKATADMRKQAGESAPEVEDLIARLSRAKGARSMLTMKFDILIKSHHYYKELVQGMKKGVVSYSGANTNVVEGYE